MSLSVSSNKLYGGLDLKYNEDTKRITGHSSQFSEVIESSYEAAMIPAELKTKDIEKINEKVSAISELQTALKKTQTSALKLRSYVGYSDSSMYGVDVIGALGKYLPSARMTGSTTDPDSLVSITVPEQTNIKSFDLRIDQLATYDTTTATTGFADPDAALGWTGDIEINGEVVTVLNTMSLYEVAQQINNVSENSNVKADLIQKESGTYYLTFQATQLASPIAIVNNIVGDAAGEVPTASGNTVTDLNAQFHFNGEDLTRSDNIIEDLLEGVTIKLLNSDVGTMHVSIEPDRRGAYEAVDDFITNYNEFMDALNKHRSEEEVLFGTRITRELRREIRSVLNQAIPGLSTNSYNDLSDLGITLAGAIVEDTASGEQANFQNLDKLIVDQQKLLDAVNNNYHDFVKFFEFKYNSTNDLAKLLDHTGRIPTTLIEDSAGNTITTRMTVSKNASDVVSAELRIIGGTLDGSTYSVTYDGQKDSPLTLSTSGNTMYLDMTKFSTSTPFWGMKFTYSDLNNIATSSSDTADFTFVQGFGDRMFETAKILQYTDQLFKSELDELSGSKEKLTEAKKNIETRAENEKARLEKQYAQLEAKIAELDSISSLMSAINARRGEK